MNAPLVGISTYREPASWGVWSNVTADLLPAAYADAIRRAGGAPVLLPPGGDAAVAAAILARLDALVIAGGADVGPDRYGQQAGPHTRSWREDRDEWELALLDAAEPRATPVLGICRGMQVMAVHAGGTLTQHLPDVVHHVGHSPGGDVYGSTLVRVAGGSRLASLVGSTVQVRCHHHQSVATHPGLVRVARSDDGATEALERAGDRFWVGVQWHPEVTDDPDLFTGLVDAARGSTSVHLSAGASCNAGKSPGVTA